MTEPVALADIKAHLRLPAGATGEDDYLTGLITAARRACERIINRSVIGCSSTISIDRFPASGSYYGHRYAREAGLLEIRLPGGDVASIESISYFGQDGTLVLLDPTEYVADRLNRPARIAPVTCWPAVADRPGAVVIAYTISPLGGDDLTLVSRAMMLLAGHWYANREAVVVDVRGTPTEIPLSVTWLLETLEQKVTG